MTDDGDVSLREESTIASTVLKFAQQQDPNAWRSLVSKYSGRVYKWARKAGLQDCDAADITQQVFAAAAVMLVRFRREEEGDSLGGWLYRVTQYKISDYWRETRREPCSAAGGSTHWRSLMALGADEPNSASGPQARISPLERELLDRVRKRCEPQTWEIFLRVTVDEVAVSDVAAEFGVPANVVYLAKSRVSRKIREEMGQRDDHRQR